MDNSESVWSSITGVPNSSARAATTWEANFGPEYPLIGLTMLSLSSVYPKQKRYAEAERTCRRSFETMRRFLPPNHPDLMNVRIALASIAHQRGDFASAIETLEEGTEKGAAPRSPAIPREYVQLLSLYSRYLRDAGESEKSKQILLQARQLSEQSGRISLSRSTIEIGEPEAGRVP